MGIWDTENFGGLGMERITGSYNPFEGNVINPISNMKASDEMADYSTFVHEIQHMHFNRCTVIGSVIELLQTELQCTPETDGKHRKKTKDRMTVLCDSFRELQEIYANSMELLWIEAYQGPEAAAAVYGRKSEKYKRYSRRFQAALKDCPSPEAKRNRVHQLCVTAASPELSTEQFTGLLTDIRGLKLYFENEGRMEKRLEAVIAEDQRYPDPAKDHRGMGFETLWPAMVRQGILIYCEWLINAGHEMVNAMDRETLVQVMEKYYQEFLTKKTEVFDVEFAARRMSIRHEAWSEEYGCILRRHSRMLYPGENYFLLGCSDDGAYIGQEVTAEELSAVTGSLKGAVVDFKEFDIRKNCPMYFSAGEIPVLFVLMTNYRQCESWLERILDEDLYFVTLFPEDVHNFYTVFFFRRRREPNVIFVYPTLKFLAGRLMETLDIKDKVLFSSQPEALKVFAGLGNEKDMLCGLKWLFSFVSGTEWDGYHLQNPASMLCSGFVRPVFDSALSIRKDNYWKLKSALPTMETVSDGLYTLMEFKEGENTGCICAQEYEGKRYPVFFRNKSSALHYKRGQVQYDAYHVVAVDHYYWDTLYASLKPDICKWCLYINEQQGILLDADVYSSNFFDKL